MRRAVICVVFVLGCGHAAPAERGGRGVPADLSALPVQPHHVPCPAHFADAHGVCTTDGGASELCRYPEGTCRCEPPREFEAVLYLRRTWTCGPGVGLGLRRRHPARDERCMASSGTIAR